VFRAAPPLQLGTSRLVKAVPLPVQSLQTKALAPSAFDTQGGLIPTDIERAKAADLITLPDGVGGANCGNCEFFQPVGSVGNCKHPKVEMQVTHRQCCSFWNQPPGTLRAWESGQQQKALHTCPDCGGTVDRGTDGSWRCPNPSCGWALFAGGVKSLSHEGEDCQRGWTKEKTGCVPTKPEVRKSNIKPIKLNHKDPRAKVARDKMINTPKILSKLRIPKVMYHVAPRKVVERILREGLKIGDRTSTGGDIRGAYLTANPLWGISSGDLEAKDPVIFSVSTDELDLRLDPEYFDEAYESPEEYIESINNGESSYALYSRDVIPPKNLSIYGDYKYAVKNPPKYSKATKSLDLKKQLIASGLAVRATDTGRALMLQRGGDDNNAGKWEFPGGHIEENELPIEAAKREWQEEVGLKLPDGVSVGSWDGSNGKYQGHVIEVNSEDSLDLKNRDEVSNPDGDVFEAVAWIDPKDFSNHNLRAELLTDLYEVRRALREKGKHYVKAWQKDLSHEGEPCSTKPGWTQATVGCVPDKPEVKESKIKLKLPAGHSVQKHPDYKETYIFTDKKGTDRFFSGSTEQEALQKYLEFLDNLPKSKKQVHPKLKVSKKTVSLAELIKGSDLEGVPTKPLNPVDSGAENIIWDVEGKEVLDGFHRTAGMLEWAKENNVDPKSIKIRVLVPKGDDALIGRAADKFAEGHEDAVTKIIETGQKALSWQSETSGGALVAPPKFPKRRSKGLTVRYVPTALPWAGFPSPGWYLIDGNRKIGPFQSQSEAYHGAGTEETFTGGRTKALSRPKLKESYFATCKREQGHCLPKGESANETIKEAPNKDTASQANKTLSGFKSALAKVKSAPVLKQINQARQFMGGVTKKIYSKLEARYGRKTALAVLASGQVADWGSVAVGAMFGHVMYIPGASVLGMLPAVAIAETWKQVSRLGGKGLEGEGDMEEAKSFLEAELKSAWEQYLKENKDSLEAAFTQAGREDKAEKALVVPASQLNGHVKAMSHEGELCKQGWSEQRTGGTNSPSPSRRFSKPTNGMANLMVWGYVSSRGYC